MQNDEVRHQEQVAKIDSATESIGADEAEHQRLQSVTSSQNADVTSVALEAQSEVAKHSPALVSSISPLKSIGEPCPNGPDPFDLAAVKRQSATSVAVRKTLVVGVKKKIDKSTWFQVCPVPGMHVEGYLLDPGEMADGLFWVSPFALSDVDDSAVRLYELHLCASKQGAGLFWWAIGLPGEDGRDMECDRIRRAYATAHGQWMRLEWDQVSRMHNQSIAVAAWPNPDWPNVGVDELIRTAFRGRVIDSADHPVVRQLKGLA